MATDQLAYIRGIHGVTVNTIEIHEKDFKDRVSNLILLYNILFFTTSLTFSNIFL